MADLDDLHAELADLRSQLKSQDGRLADQERVVQGIAELLGAKEPAFALSPWWWPTMTQSQADHAWKILTEWVDGLIIPRYDDGKNDCALGELPYSTRVLRCWFAHPGIVDKLSALFWAQKGDYRRSAAAHGPLDWQENWLPKTLDALDKEFREKKCIASCSYLNKTIAGVAPKHDTLSLRDRMHWIKVDVERRAK